jgi:aspartate racemase
LKRIGLLGGISHSTTIEYYNRILELYNRQYQNIDYPEIVIYSLSHGKFKKYENANHIDKYLEYISQGIKALIDSGVEIIALAANSPHRVINELRNSFDIPIISALDSAYNEANRLEIKKGLLLGIKFTMQSDFYHDRFEQGGIELISPDLNEQDIIDDIIFNKLINTKEIDEISKSQILKIINRYPVDGIILGCMRLPIFFNEKTVEGYVLVNTLDKHIEDILEHAK